MKLLRMTQEALPPPLTQVQGESLSHKRTVPRRKAPHPFAPQIYRGRALPRPSLSRRSPHMEAAIGTGNPGFPHGYTGFESEKILVIVVSLLVLVEAGRCKRSAPSWSGKWWGKRRDHRRLFVCQAEQLPVTRGTDQLPTEIHAEALEASAVVRIYCLRVTCGVPGLRHPTGQRTT